MSEDDLYAGEGDERPGPTARQLVLQSWGVVKEKDEGLIYAAAVPLGLGVVLGSLAVPASRSPWGAELMTTVVAVLGVIPWTLFGISWHRLILQGAFPPLLPSWSPAHTRFALFLAAGRLAVALLFGALIVGPASGSGLLPLLIAGFIGALLVIAYVQTRLSLFLPATAVRRPMSLAGAWTLGGGMVWVLAGVMVLSALAGLGVYLLLFVLGFLVRALTPLSAELVAVPVGVVTALVVEVLAIGALSFAYRYVLEEEERLRPVRPAPVPGGAPARG